jgi:hypothetical protein
MNMAGLRALIVDAIDVGEEDVTAVEQRHPLVFLGSPIAGHSMPKKRGDDPHPSHSFNKFWKLSSIENKIDVIFVLLSGACK